MADLDLTDFMKEGSGGVTDLSWLSVDEKDYQKHDRLPEQNLDIAPELTQLWNNEDKLASALVPNTGGPRASTSSSSQGGTTPEIVRTARLTIMQTTDARKIQDTLYSRFDRTALSGARTALASVLAERGLLGRLYVAAADFPGCAKGGSQDAAFVRRFAGEAKYVVAKTACGGCSHRQVLTGGASHCGVFHKQIVMDVPYTDDLAQEVEQTQAALGKAVQASASDPKDRIRQAFLAALPQRTATFSGVSQAPQKPVAVASEEKLVAVSSLMRRRAEEEQRKVAVEKARPIVGFLRREMLKGHGPAELTRSLRLSFDLRDLQASRAEWEPVFREVGLFGSVYSTQESFSDCRDGASFLSKHGSNVRAIVAGSKCGTCVFSQAGNCSVYGRKLVREASDILTADTVRTVIDEHKAAGRLPVEASHRSWGDTPAAALKAIHKTASMPQAAALSSGLRGVVEKAFYGAGPRSSTGNELTTRSIIKAAKQYMNEGLYGEDLGTVLKGRFEVRDLMAAAEPLRAALAEQGLQGLKYIDPTVYDDYGAGCKEAARKHRSRSSVKFAKVGDKCGTCVHQSRQGHCSVLVKQLVVEPPYVDKLAEQRAVLASGRSTEVSYASLMNNGLTMMQEYELQKGAGEIDLNPEGSSGASDIEFGAHTVKL